MKKIKEHNIEDVNWQSDIEKVELNDDSWKVKVIMIEASEIEQENMYLKEFEKGAAQGNRFVIKNISKIETFFMIKQLGGQNKTVPVLMKAQSYLKDNKKLPAEIVALVIKHLILTLKEEYLYVVQQKLSVEVGLKHESEIMINKVEIKGKIKTRVKKSADSSTSKHKSNVEKQITSSITEADDAKKYHTALRTRGEEWRDKKLLEDFPEDGPNLYVAITGFTEPYLPGCLIRIGVPLIAIVKLVIDPKTVRTPSKLSRNIKSDTDLNKKCRMFWECLQTCRSECDRDNLKNTAMVVFSPTLFDGDINLNDPDVIVNNQEKIYNEICYLMYDLQDLTRQHAHFLDNFKVSLIPDEKPNEHLQRDYSKNNTIPLESTFITTIYSILDNMLKTVSKTATFKQTFHNDKVAKNYVSDKNNSLQAETLFGEVFYKLQNNDIAKKKYRVTQKNEFENDQNPIVIHFGDSLRCSSFHLSDCNLYDAIWPMLRGLPVINLWQEFKRHSEEMQAQVNFHINLLSSFFDRKFEIPQLTILIQMLHCTKLHNVRKSFVDQNPQHSSTSPRKRLLKRSCRVEPLARDLIIKTAEINSMLHKKLLQLCSHDTHTLYDDKSKQESKNNFIFNCHALGEILNKINTPNNIINDFEYFEEFKDIISLQVLNDAYTEFRSCIYNYCEITDTLILMFWNRCNNTGLTREEWRGHIATPICLQDFFEFVFDEKYDWIQNEEKIYEQCMNKSPTKVTDEKKRLVVSGCCYNTDEFDFLMDGSLKHNDLLNYVCPETQESLIKVSVISSPKIHSKISISSRLTRRSKNFESSLTSSESSIEDVSFKEMFHGYNLCDRRVEAIGKESAYFSKDGSIIISKYTSFLQIDSKYLCLNVVADKTEFWIHRIVGAESMDYSEAFRISTNDMISVNVKQHIHSTANNSYSRNILEHARNLVTDDDKKQLAEVTYSLSLVWPNGLITETVQDSENEISYIKQSFSLPDSTNFEDKRCIGMNGEVVIYKKNGNIEILQPAGACINISKYEKRTKSDLDSHEIYNDDIKNVVKHKKREQSDHELHKIPSQFKNIESELIFLEYETVDSNGLCQKWTQDVLLDEQNLLSRTTSDYCLGEVLTKRSDGTIIFLNKNGDLVTTYPNNTKITTSYLIESDDIYPEYSVYELDFNEQIKINKNELYVSIQIVYTIEHPNFTTITINRSDTNISIESQNNMLVTLTNNHNYEFHFDDNTNAKFNGEYLTIYSNRTHKENVCSVNVKCNTKDYETVNKVWLHMKDSFDKDIVVDQDGEISVTEINVFDDKEETVQETSFDTWKRLQEAKAVKFFILKRDLSCAELVHRDLVKEYEETYSDRTWSSSKVFKSFGDYRNVLSIITPIKLTSSEKWIMNSKFCNQQRSRLAYKDLKHDAGKGFYHWMRPYKIYEPKSIAPFDKIQKSLPKAYVLRTLERLWDDNDKLCLITHELKTAIEKYNRAIEFNKMYYTNPPLQDFRCDEEIIKDDNILQKVDERVYEDLAKRRAAAGIEFSQPITITTLPLQGTPSTARDDDKAQSSILNAQNALQRSGFPSLRSQPQRLERERSCFMWSKNKHRVKRLPSSKAITMTAGYKNYTPTGSPTKEMGSSHESVTKRVETEADMKPRLKEYWRQRQEDYEEEQRNNSILNAQNALQRSGFPSLRSQPQRLERERSCFMWSKNKHRVKRLPSSKAITMTAGYKNYTPTGSPTKEMGSSHESVTKRVETEADMKPRLKEYWRQRQEDYEEEQRNKYLLREGLVPPYFRNVLGGASWLENHKSYKQVDGE